MHQLPNPITDSFVQDTAHYKDSTSLLLNRKQWLYVQKRYNLTARERQIAELICQGLRNGSIAKHLRIRTGTVKTHIRNIYRKVRVKSKIAMLLRFVAESKELYTLYEETHSTQITD